MANNYYVDMAIHGRKESLDELQNILQQELYEGQSWEDWYTMDKSLRRMGFDPDKLDVRAYTEQVERMTDNDLSVIYVGA